MKIKINNDHKSFSAHLHYAILNSSSTVIAASFVGLNTAVNAIESAFILGSDGEIEHTEGTTHFRTRSGQCKRLSYQAGSGISHGVLLDKNAVYSVNKGTLNANGNLNPVIIAPEGNVKEMVGKFLSTIYSLPPEWEDKYYDLIYERIEVLQVLSNPEYKTWNNMIAVQLMGIDQEFVENKISEALRGGRLTIPPSEVEGKFDPNWTAQEYTQANAPILGQQIGEIKALYTPYEDKLSPTIASLKRIPFPAQAHCIQGIVNALEYRFDALGIGDMGTGKTQITVGVIHVLYHNKGIRRILTTATGLVVPKWAQEIRKILPGYVKIRIIKSTEDAIKMVREFKENPRPKHLEIVLISIDRSKFGAEPFFTGRWQRVKGAKYKAWHCCQCGKPLPDEDEYYDLKEQLKKNPEAMPAMYADWTDLVEKPKRPPNEDDLNNSIFNNVITGNGVPRGYIGRWRKKSKLKKCPYCEAKFPNRDAKLWRPANKHRGETKMSHRWFICRILKNAGKIFDLLVTDEIHQTKASDSGRGYALSQLVKCTKKFLGLTGTLTTGKSNSIKHILWRADPATLIKEGFTRDVGDWTWAQRYGVLEEIMDKDDAEETEDEGIITVRKGAKSRMKEMPGISPELTATYLLDRSIFLELGDLGLPLPELKEIPVFIEMDEESGHKAEYSRLHRDLYEACAKAAQAGNSGAFSKFIPTSINYGDRPDLGAEVEVGEDLFQAEQFDENYFHAKERKLVEIVEKELEENRNIVIYTKYSRQYKMNERLKKVLNDHNIDCVIMPSSISTDKRIEWVEEQAKQGTKIIICNLELLSVGVDLLEYPTIIKYQLDFRVNEDRQNGRRHWRIGQNRECRTYYMVYDETYQMAQFKRVMAGRGHAMFVEGRLDRSELSEYAMDENTSMAYNITQCLAESDLAEKWTKLAEKDIDENIETVSEDKFQQRMEETMENLVNETLRLCGVDPAEYWKRNEQPEEVIDVTATPVEDIKEHAPTIEKDSDVIIIDDEPQSDIIIVDIDIEDYYNYDSIELLATAEPVETRGEVITLFPEFEGEKPEKPKKTRKTRSSKKKKPAEEQINLLEFMA
ncbi:MAG: hypothetical protein K9L17_13420 [Clostridiales bacterium]|nr:hypothetical protein [Clostridiales bacterium]MCF8023675.1 hypothetical protein [Clostridiales bacterium]